MHAVVAVVAAASWLGEALLVAQPALAPALDPAAAVAAAAAGVVPARRRVAAAAVAAAAVWVAVPTALRAVAVQADRVCWAEGCADWLARISVDAALEATAAGVAVGAHASAVSEVWLSLILNP